MVQVQVVRATEALESYQTRRGKMRGDCTLRPIWGGVGVPSSFSVRRVDSNHLIHTSHLMITNVVHSLRRGWDLHLLAGNVVKGAQQKVGGSGR